MVPKSHVQDVLGAVLVDVTLQDVIIRLLSENMQRTSLLGQIVEVTLHIKLVSEECALQPKMAECE